jgi:hypothetical protein
MTNSSLPRVAVVAIAVTALTSSALAQQTPPLTPAEIEAAYAVAIRDRTKDIVVLLDLTDAAKSNRVMELIMAQYRALRSRDETIKEKVKSAGKAGDAAVDRASLFVTMSKPLHDQFLTKLATELTPDQVEKVKDKMTYNKVKVTYDAYCAIIPGLTDADKAKILEQLKLAREEAIDGGSANEKSEIFQKYKDKINEYLNAHGHDVAKAYAEWNAKQEQAEKDKSSGGGAPSPK